MVDILAAILNFLKSSMMPAQHHLDDLTLNIILQQNYQLKPIYKTLTTEISIIFRKKTNIGGHLMILYDVGLSLFKKKTAAHPLTESIFKTNIHNTST